MTRFLLCEVGACKTRSVYAAVTICATLINIQTHIQTDSILTSLYE